MDNINISSAQEMEGLGGRLAGLTPVGTIIYLMGDLGVGKTTLVRGFLRAQGYKGAVKSPTYTLIEPYEFGGYGIYHFDLYRLADPEELEYLGAREYFAGQGICFIEWPERGAGYLPPADLGIEIHYQGTSRSVSFTGQSEAGQTLMMRMRKD